MLSLRPYQQAAIAAIYDYFAEKSGHPLVVIPTAGGKAFVLAAFVQGVLRQWPDQRILIVTHVRELIAQNHAEMIGPVARGTGRHLFGGPAQARDRRARAVRRHPVDPPARL